MFGCDLGDFGPFDATTLGNHGENRGGRPSAPVQLGDQTVGDDPFQVARESTAGDVAERADLRLGGQGKAVLGIDPGWLQQLFAERV